MAHDKIRAAARKRMEQTGEPYNVARRAVIRAHRRMAGGPARTMAALPAVSAALNAKVLEISRAADQAVKAYAMATVPDVSAALNVKMLEISRAASQAAKIQALAALPAVSAALNAKVLEISRAADQAAKINAMLRAVDGD